MENARGDCARLPSSSPLPAPAGFGGSAPAAGSLPTQKKTQCKHNKANTKRNTPQTGARAQVDGRRGTFLVNVNDMYIGASLLAYGEWSDEEVRVMALNQPPDGVPPRAVMISTWSPFCR